MLVYRFIKTHTQANVIARSEATRQSIVYKKLKIASLSLSMTISYADIFVKRYTRNEHDFGDRRICYLSA
ncbi:MAG: hypothetical protein HBSAPP01_15620 [Candidatus Brocadia sapporoensis]|nr:MAG: hypothetical protein HBSAPP01_15620 [Candidatus Brocadia sapporoensis]